jgi:anti-anti-sigma factor
MDLTIKVDRTSSLVILVCSGRIVYGPECQQLVDLVTLTLAESQTVGLDFSEVRALDSAGVGALARILTTARRNRKSLVVINPSERVREVLHLTKLDTIFDIFKNHDAAITAFSSGK